MGLLPDWRIRKEVKIVPFVEEGKRPGKISYGVSSYGYDVRVGYKFKIFTPTNCSVVDPKAFDPKVFVDVDITPKEGSEVPDHILIPPNSFCLAESLEYFEMPSNVTGLVCCKSTYARCAIVAPSTILEAGWNGKITLEISNCSSLPAKVYAAEGIAQILFIETHDACEKTYATRQGKYQNQDGITLPFVV